MKKILLAVLALTLISASFAVAEEINEEDSAPVHNIERIEIIDSNTNGTGVVVDSMRVTVNITAERRNDVYAHLYGEASSNRKSTIPKLVMDKSGRNLQIILDSGKGTKLFYMRKGEVTLDVRIPENFDRELFVRFSSARIFAENIACDTIGIRTSSGDMNLKELASDSLDLHASSGDIDVSVFEGRNAAIHTSSGRITAEELNGDEGEITSISGDIRIGSLFGNFTIKASSGDIRVEESEGTMSADASSGSVRFLDARGRYKAESSSGDIEFNFNGNEGYLDAHASSGSVEVEELNGSVDLFSTSGNIEAVLTELKDDCRIKASSGDISIELPKKSDFFVDAKTSSGRIKIDFPVTVQGDIDKDEIQGSVGSGDHELYLRSSSGDINIQQK